MTKAEKRVVRAAMRWYRVNNRAMYSFETVATGENLRKACAALAKRKPGKRGEG